MPLWDGRKAVAEDKKSLSAVGGNSDGVTACLERGRSEAHRWRQLRLIGSVGVKKSVFPDVT